MSRGLIESTLNMKMDVYEANVKTWSRTFSCFKRRVKIKAYRALK